jgi:BlaI family penicillinase repressor
MARPRAKELTERELEIMQIFWDSTPPGSPAMEGESSSSGDMTAQKIRDGLAAAGRELAYTTVATLIRILQDKGFLQQTSDQRPFRYAPARTFEEVSGSLVSDLVQKVFGGSREELLIRLIDEQELSAEQRQMLEDIVRTEKAKTKRAQEEE